jgi:hypothetical protein
MRSHTLDDRHAGLDPAINETISAPPEAWITGPRPVMTTIGTAIEH